MKLKTYKHRHYLTEFRKRRTIKVKMIPEKYIGIAEELVIQDDKKKRLTNIERIQLEELLLRETLGKITRDYISQFIFKGVRKVKVKHGENRYEAIFDITRVHCSKLFYTLAIKIIKYNLGSIKAQS